MRAAQRVGAVAAAQPDGVRAGGQDAQDADRGVLGRGHVAVQQGDGAALYQRLPVGDPAPHHRQDEQARHQTQ